MNRKIKIALICAVGGHFQQMERLKNLYNKHEHFFITAKDKSNIDPKDIKENMYFIADINERRGLRNPFLLIKAFFQTLKILRKEKPDLIISTGPGIAVPAFFWAKFLPIKTIFIESITRIHGLSMAGKVCYRLGNRFFVQHEELLKKYPKAEYKGILYENY